MKSFSESGKYKILYRAAVFFIAFIMMFTVIVPEMTVFGGVGTTVKASSTAAGVSGTTKSYKYRAFVIVAEYYGGYWYTYRKEHWEVVVRDRIKKVDPDVKDDEIDINVRHTLEFNCINDDIIGSYDYVLFVGNAPFYHVGDKVSFTNEDMPISGLENTSVAAGNDITNAAVEKIKKFYDCGYPVEYMGYYGKSFEDKMGSAVEGDANETNMAKLYEATNGKDHLISEAGVTNTTDNDNKIKNLKENRVTLEVTKKPKNYTEGFDNSNQDTSKVLDYTFEIKDNKPSAESRKYTAKLYIDMNSDGRFDDDTESVSNLGITLYSNRKTNVRSDALKVNTKYKLTVNASEYIGFLNWKLVVSDNSDSSHRFAFESGACKLQLMKGQAKEKLNIVQLIASPYPNMNSYSDANTRNNVYLPTKQEVEWINNTNYKNNRDTFCHIVKQTNIEGLFDVDETNPGLKIWDSQVDSNDNSVNERLKTLCYFYEALYKGTNDESGKYNSDMALLYDIDIRRIYVNNLSVAARKDGYSRKAGESDYEYLYRFLTDKFDMIIIGFSDHYDDIADDVSTAIEAFATEGKAVLFTHDTSSYVNTWREGSDNNNWGYHINQKFRNLLGMDRFGVTLKNGSGGSLTQAQLRAAGKDYNNKGLLHGYTDMTLIDNIRRAIEINRNAPNYSPDADNFPNNVGGKNNQAITWTTALINMGSITEYPYVTSKLIASKVDSFEFNIKGTHAQYYQLDLESDDIVVWYALNGTNLYADRYNDGRNNYYIYSKGNIIYSGAGHSAGLTDGEVRLFVNTMMAAHRAGSSPVSIEMTDWDASTTKTEVGRTSYDYVTLPVDYIKKSTGGAYGESIVNNKSNGKTQQYRRVKFKVYDRIVSSNKTGLSINFYKSSSNTDMSNATKLSYYANSIYRMSDGKVVMKNGTLVSGQSIQPGVEYYIYVPLSEFNSKLIFRGEVTSSVKLTGRTDSFSIKNSVYVNFNNRLQFNLS